MGSELCLAADDADARDLPDSGGTGSSGDTAAPGVANPSAPYFDDRGGLPGVSSEGGETV